MNFRERNRGKRAELKKRHDEANFRGKEGSKGGGVPKSLILKNKVPEGVSQWIPKEGEHFFDIVPFETGNNHPKDPEGELSINIEYYQHSGIGAEGGAYPCNLKNWGKACPICDYISENDLSADDWKKLKPKWYAAYLVAVYTTEEEVKKGTQIFTIAHYFMQDHLNKLQVDTRTGERFEYGDYEEGKTIGFTKTKTGKYTYDYSGHKLLARKDADGPYILADHFLDAQFPLDEVLNLEMDYDELKEIFYTGSDLTSNYSKNSGRSINKNKENPTSRARSRTSTKKARKPREVPECPQGHEFGISFKEDVMCDECEIYDDCEASYELQTDESSVPDKPTPPPSAPKTSRRSRSERKSPANETDTKTNRSRRGRSSRR
jgi:hypothetical protein